MPKRVLITGSAGFIGFHLAEYLLKEGATVHGYDGFLDYYDVNLKRRRHALLERFEGFTSTESMLENQDALDEAADTFRPDLIVHLAAQAGVRYSLENPRAYIDSNIIGTFNVMEVARRLDVRHFLLASTSSVYGANVDMPFKETQKADSQLTMYAATKKANESMAHSYAHLWKIPTTVFRFFTVYGAWGRPDLALFKFVDAILSESPIDVYNNGHMYRDFTHVTDLVRAIRLLMDAIPPVPSPGHEPIEGDSLSPVAPFRIVNIGNSEQVNLLDFINAIEDVLGKKAIRNYLPMQKGDVPSTWADVELLEKLTGFRGSTHYTDGIADFVSWFRQYYGR